MWIRLDHNSFDLQWYCPICNSSDLEYQAADIEDNTVSYRWTCNECKSEWREWYTIEFYSQNVLFDWKQWLSTDDPNRERKSF